MFQLMVRLHGKRGSSGGIHSQQRILGLFLPISAAGHDRESQSLGDNAEDHAEPETSTFVVVHKGKDDSRR